MMATRHQLRVGTMCASCLLAATTLAIYWPSGQRALDIGQAWWRTALK